MVSLLWVSIVSCLPTRATILSTSFEVYSSTVAVLLFCWSLSISLTSFLNYVPHHFDIIFLVIHVQPPVDRSHFRWILLILLYLFSSFALKEQGTCIKGWTCFCLQHPLKHDETSIVDDFSLNAFHCFFCPHFVCMLLLTISSQWPSEINFWTRTCRKCLDNLNEVSRMVCIPIY